MAWTYPTDQLDNPQAIAGLTASFWTDLFGGAANVTDLARAYGLTERQLFEQQQELQDTVGVTTCPSYHTQDWYPLTLLQSQEGPAQPLDPDAATGNLAVAYAIPSPIRDFLFAAGDIINPSVTWSRGVTTDLDLVNNRIIFAVSPFLESGLIPTPVVTGGVITDQSLTIWLFKAKVDWQYVQTGFGSVVSVPGPTGEAYRKMVQAIYLSVSTGTVYDAVARVVEALSDVPSVKNTGEIVQAITSDQTHTLIITDQQVYRFVAGATALVNVGQTLNKDDPLIDAVRVVEPTNGSLPAFINQLSLGQGFVLADIPNELIFNNQNESLNVQTNVSGYTKLSWNLGGFPNDIATFFNDLHARGVANGATLANYLDTRPPPQIGQPTAANLPTSINPLAFLFQNVLRANCLLVYLRVRQFGPHALGTGLAWVLRKIVPPHVAVIIYADLQQPDEFVTMSGPGSLTAPGYLESYSLYSIPG